MAGVDGHRRQHGIDRSPKVVVDELPLFFGEVLGGDEPDAVLLQLREHFFAEAPVLAVDEFTRAGVGLLVQFVHRELLGEVVLRFVESQDLRTESGQADHQEFVEIAAKNGEELDPFE